MRNFGEAALPPDVAKAQEAAMKMCAESSPAPDYRQESAGVAYEHMLDFVACVENEGYPLPAPPTRETWVDGLAQGSGWNPLYEGFDDVPEAEVTHVVTTEELSRLQTVCHPGVLGRYTTYVAD